MMEMSTIGMMKDYWNS